jgi:hypothetical protein
MKKEWPARVSRAGIARATGGRIGDLVQSGVALVDIT